jgi:hypothetical protein
VTSDPFFSDHWDDIDPGWQMPWYAARRRYPRWARRLFGVGPGPEKKVPGYGFDDAVAVFLAVRRLVPDEWPGVIKVVVPLRDSDGLVTDPPELSSLVPDWREPPLVYLLPVPCLAGMAVGWDAAGYESGYPELPPELRDGRTSVVFHSLWTDRAWGTPPTWYNNYISIVGLPSGKPDSQ